MFSVGPAQTVERIHEDLTPPRSQVLFGIPVSASGDEDDDWFFTYFQPYRYVLNRIPVYPSIGNHDADESEACDDRDAGRRQLLPVRAAGRGRGGGPRVVPSGAVLPVPLRLGHRVRLHRHLERSVLHESTACSRSRSTGSSSKRRSRRSLDGVRVADPVRAPSAVQCRPASWQHQRRWQSCCRCSSARG